MVRAFLSCFVFLAFATFLASARPALAGDGLQGKVALSDGTVLEGEILTRGNLPIRLYALASKRFRRVHLSELARLTVKVTKAEQVKEFEWVEMGSDEKIFTGRTFPRKDFEGEIELLSGEKLTGHLLGVVYWRSDEETRKLELTRYLRGKAGQKLADLVHVKEIVFPDAVRRVSCTLRLELKGASPKVRVFVLGTASPVFWDAGADGEGIWTVKNLSPGVYDFVVVGKKRVVLGLSAPAASSGGKPLTEEVRGAIRARAAGIENFFTLKEPLYITGTDRAVRALVRMIRTEKSTFDRKKGRQRFYRYEIWTLGKVGERWIVEDRTFVTRGKVPQESGRKEPGAVREKALEGLEVGEGERERRVVFDLGRGKEK